jgi:hypothetical protein
MQVWTLVVVRVVAFPDYYGHLAQVVIDCTDFGYVVTLW